MKFIARKLSIEFYKLDRHKCYTHVSDVSLAAQFDVHARVWIVRQ